MNERIKELDKVAQEYAGSIAGNDEDSNYVAWFNIYKEKFAELIVKECADILMKPEYAMNHPEELGDYNRGWVNGRLLGIEHIWEHFGDE
jgi:hypothetical protein